jgi:1-deoxy-D-xylulose-5-phosphate reductoisomerase
MPKKKIVILGSTGSVGVSALKVIQKLSDQFEVVGLTAGKNIKMLIQQIHAFKPKLAAIQDVNLFNELKQQTHGLPTRVLAGEAGIEEVAVQETKPLLLSAIVGGAGLKPTLSAICNGQNIALANKETLVMAGDLMTAEAEKRNVMIIPVDSEHSAIFQCLYGNKQPLEIHKLILTASGGPFREWKMRHFKKIKLEDALSHPTWKMGPKITIDSSTLMNKGLEVIEAKYLFNVELGKIDVVIHPESIVHSMVEYIDGSILAQLAVPDMQLPIQFAITYPKRFKTPVQRMDLTKLSGLHFFKPDFRKFPCLDLAYTAAKLGGSMTIVLNAANEMGVRLFLENKIPFLKIPKLIERVMLKHRVMTKLRLSAILEVDQWARQEALSFA